ncbi:5176_t:CDS:2 [Paraglomus occultum]|uniref:Holocytochrome c-type synthase n=1 Tax=Paraglomus occultum TaxID=144539 RepID=A0A9N9FWT3_9GLOM|nr:5176_t:CDS:2 [Paraglomus occultum]
MSETSTTTKSACPIDHRSRSGFLSSFSRQDTLSDSNSNAQGCTSDAVDKSSPQTPTSSQQTPLDNQRVVSSIPRSSQTPSDYWVYPSEQQFFNALKRKNHDPNEADMRPVVHIHNAVNERAWGEILKWERLHEGSSKCPVKLKSFRGRPGDLSFKARMYGLLGYTYPFDRHDWVIDRCGKEVRYIIDFYSGKPDSKNPHSVSFYIDARPALTLEGVVDRIRMTFASWN